MRIHFTLAVVIGLSTVSFADGPGDNDPTKVRRVPRLGVEVPADVAVELRKGLLNLAERLDQIQRQKPSDTGVISDIEIFYRAVNVALNYREFFAERDINLARELLKEGTARADAWLDSKQATWADDTGLVVRGFRSRIDNTVQPYGLVVPESWSPDSAQKFRLDIWFHGRGETSGELKFIAQRMKTVGNYAPKDTIVLHPYGRYSNAFKFAGEVDVFEAMEDVKKRYRIDDDQISVRGFSMGGAACWQFAVHYPSLWFAANPGAGFSETPEFLKSFQGETLNPPWYEEKMWRLYNCTDHAINLYHCPTVAYSGEVDRQKQAADIMATALEKEQITLTHIIGPKTGHKIHPDSKVIIERKMDSLAKVGRDQTPTSLKFTTYTLKYNQIHWLTIDALNEHWEKATVEASIKGNRITLKTSNIAAVTLDFPAGTAPFDIHKPVRIVHGTTEFISTRPGSDRSWSQHIAFNGNDKDSRSKDTLPDDTLRKRHNLQGPIDDAFMDSFVIVKPTEKGYSKQLDDWAKSETEHLIEHWRRHFRGDARVITDKQLNDDWISNSNLILFGDPSSNSVIAKVTEQLPIKWNDKTVSIGSKSFDSSIHAPALIYPNPLNPNRYVVINSGFTYREYDYLNNARQVPKLPDWAIFDLRTPVGSRYAGKVVAADFFDEFWNLKKN